MWKVTVRSMLITYAVRSTVHDYLHVRVLQQVICVHAKLHIWRGFFFSFAMFWLHWETSSSDEFASHLQSPLVPVASVHCPPSAADGLGRSAGLLCDKIYVCIYWVPLKLNRHGWNVNGFWTGRETAGIWRICLC